MIRRSAGRGISALLSRTVVSLGRDSSATVVEEIVPGDDASDGVGAMFGGTLEAVVGDGSVLKCSSLENLGTGTAAFLNRHANAGESSEVQWALGYVGGEMVRSRVDNLLNGRGAKVKEVQVLYGDKAQFFDLFSHTRHFAEDTVSDLLSKEFPPPGVIEDWPAWLAQADDEETTIRIRQQTHTGRPCGSAAFVEQLEGLVGRILHPARRGRKARTAVLRGHSDDKSQPNS